MLRFKIKHVDATPELKPKPLTLELAHHPDGVVVKVADADCGALVVIKRDGTITRLINVNPELGFKLDNYRRVEIANSEV